MNDLTINRTPNPDCPACRSKAVHNPAEWMLHHPLAGHGRNKELGWTHEDLKKHAEKANRAVGSIPAADRSDDPLAGV
jgi:hypothetical protein